MQQKLIELQGDIDKCTIVVADFNTTLWIIDSTQRQKIIKNIEHLNSIIHQIDITDIHRTLHKTAAANTFSSQV